MKPRSPEFEDYSTYMQAHGVEEPQTGTEIEVIGFFSHSQEPG